MNRRRTIIALMALGSVPFAAEAQQAAKVPRIGYLSLILAANVRGRDAFVEGLRDLGYVQGRNVVIEYRSADGERTERDMLNGAEVAARALGVQLQVVEARGPSDIDKSFSDIIKAHAGALTVPSTPMFSSERRRLVDLAAKNRLPTLFTFEQ